MNWFVTIVGLLQFGASIHSLLNKHYLWGMLWFTYGSTNFILFFLEGK